MESGVSVAGLMTQVLPETSAGKSFQLGMAMGKFHGVMRPTTPTGMRTLMANLFCSSEGVVIAKEPAAFAGHVKGLVDGFLHVAAGFGQHLAHFAGHVAGVLFLALLQQDAGAQQDLGPLGRGNEAPGGKGLLRRGDGQVHVFGVRGGKRADDVGVVGGIQVQDGLAARGRQPLAADQIVVGGIGHESSSKIESVDSDQWTAVRT